MQSSLWLAAGSGRQGKARSKGKEGEASWKRRDWVGLHEQRSAVQCSAVAWSFVGVLRFVEYMYRIYELHIGCIFRG